MKLMILLVALAGLCVSDALKILVIYPIPGKSHGILGDAVVNHLLDAGHQVTYILPFEKKSHPNLTQVVAVDNSKYFSENTLSIKMIMDKQINMQDINFVQMMMFNISATTLSQDSVQTFLQDPRQNFDVIISEWLFTEAYSVLAGIYRCPLIWFSTVEPHWQVMRLIDETMNPSFNSDILSDKVPPFSFWERLEQLKIQFDGYWRLRYFAALENEVYQKNIVPIIKQRGHPVPDYEDLVYNASLMFGNSHVSMGLASRLPQSYKPVGGYHIDTKIDPLTGDLKKLLDNAKDGAIYFSMGSNLKSKDIPDELKTGILQVFSELKQTVIWKFEEVLPNAPQNVHILTWAPQPSILAHPNTILFITHGGLLSTTEAIHFGKPIIGIPVFADQFVNVNRAVQKGFARKVDLSYHMVDELRKEIKEVLSNPIYAQNAKEFSFIYHDRPTTPAKEFIHWVEHVVKTKGAPHLRSPALLLPWYQRMYMDFAALLLATLLLVLYSLKLIVCRVMAISKSANKKKTL